MNPQTTSRNPEFLEESHREKPFRTFSERIDALHAKMDRVIAETRPYIEDRDKKIVEFA